MGIYFNPTNGSFQKAVRSRIYVDKTGLLMHLNSVINTENNCIALSHARRFGKSQAAGMIDAYYSISSDSRDLFSRFEIAESPDFDQYLNKYNVIHLDISSFADRYKDDLVDNIWNMIYDEIAQAYPAVMDRSKPVSSILAQVHLMSDRQFVIIIDEWDCIIRNHSDRKDLVHKYLQFLHSIFKSEEANSFLALGYITGILPIKKIKDESALNNFSEFTMIESDELTEYYGFTEDEVKELCREYGMEFDTVKQWYDGYIISGIHMYNPNSVCYAMIKKDCREFWKNTSAFESINKYIELNFDGLKEAALALIKDDTVKVNTGNFKNDLSEINSKDDALTALIHLGYLGYDKKTRKAFIPNHEVKLAFQSALSEGKWNDIAKIISRADDLLDATIDGDADTVADIIELAHELYTSINTYNDENAMRCVLYSAYLTAPAYYTIVPELPSGKGYADFAFIPRSGCQDKPALIVELKYNKSTDSAISQIKNKRYTGALAGYLDNLLLVGINYDKKSKRHECVIEKVQ